VVMNLFSHISYFEFRDDWRTTPTHIGEIVQIGWISILSAYMLRWLVIFQALSEEAAPRSAFQHK
jgi:hypothetical protein